MFFFTDSVDWLHTLLDEEKCQSSICPFYLIEELLERLSNMFQVLVWLELMVQEHLYICICKILNYSNYCFDNQRRLLPFLETLPLLLPKLSKYNYVNIIKEISS